MLRRFSLIFIGCVGLLAANQVVAQPPPPPPPGSLSGTDVPLDTNSAMLLLAGALYGTINLRKKK